MVIKYYIKNVYGVNRRYILDKKIALHINALTNEKTLSMEHMEALTQLGFEFEQVLEPMEHYQK